MVSSKKTVGDVECYIKKELKKKLEKDLRDLKMVKEADLECCAYFHLRKYLYRDSSWKIFARKYTRQTQHYIDLLLFKKYKPRISIELKWNKQSIGKKDERSLHKSVHELCVNRAYFISTIIGRIESFEKKPHPGKIAPYNIKGIYVKLGVHDKESRKKWHNDRQKLMKKMTKGKAKHKKYKNRLI